MILMNERTQAMFDDDASYPYLNEGVQLLSVEPDFANNMDLVTEWVQLCTVTNSTPGVPNGGDLMPQWRTNTVTDLWMPDWPMFADLSYTKTELLTAGWEGFPLGDLNWFPAEKSKWKATGESEKLWAALKAGEIPSGIKRNEIRNTQLSVYPNPFTNTTNVEFVLAGGANVELNVYNLVGQKVMSAALGHRTSGKHNITLNKSDLHSGMYILQIDAGNLGRVSTGITLH